MLFKKINIYTNIYYFLYMKILFNILCINKFVKIKKLYLQETHLVIYKIQAKYHYHFCMFKKKTKR